ncbi:galactofuranose transport system ATP-binding protein [Janthinobacterium sp. CG_23.3]|uniref:sugar ABC transporter ATP-binding protein n=1 Tax=Janthinobacterium sp. CG_23.3 TaxID=3349634 RepID=UPI0038D4FB83
MHSIPPRAAHATTTPVLAVSGIVKSYPGVRALADVALRLFPGEVHVLMGQNGAGKSTLIKVLTGVEKPDAGRIELNGEAIRPSSVQQAQALGISTVYQELNLCPNLSVAENIYIGRFPMRGAAIDWRTLERQARLALHTLNIDVDVGEPLSHYPVAIQQMVAIARAVSAEARILILDEPTSSLDDGEVERLFGVMRQLRAKGMAILFVTHFLDQTYAVADRITVLRNGAREGEYLAADLPRLALINKMVGRDLAQTPRAARAAPSPAAVPFLQARGLARTGSVQAFDLDLYPGQVLGLGGLLGSGRSEIARLLFGIDRADAGGLHVGGSGARFASPRDAVRHGIALCPEERKTDGIIAELSIRENIVLALQAKRGMFRYLPMKRQQELADGYIAALGIRTPDAEKPIGQLSGGNQQKALLARWLATAPKLLILDEPTRGIDIAAKQEIMELITAECRKGLAILFISSEMSEVLRISDRVAVLRDRSKIAELDVGDTDEQGIYQLIAGGRA